MPSTFLSFSGFLKYGAIICRSKPQNEEEAERTEQEQRRADEGSGAAEQRRFRRTTTRMLCGGPPDIARLRGTVDTHKLRVLEERQRVRFSAREKTLLRGTPMSAS